MYSDHTSTRKMVGIRSGITQNDLPSERGVLHTSQEPHIRFDEFDKRLAGKEKVAQITSNICHYSRSDVWEKGGSSDMIKYRVPNTRNQGGVTRGRETSLANRS